MIRSYRSPEPCLRLGGGMTRNGSEDKSADIRPHIVGPTHGCSRNNSRIIHASSERSLTLLSDNPDYLKVYLVYLNEFPNG